ncbi:MAG: M20/M25/M40 family metallo-hydrolase, partial [Planctomycetota bacterium]
METKTAQQLSQELKPQLVEWRRDFHQHPELGYQETRTARLVAERLRSFGLEVQTGLGVTGVVGTLVGARGPGNKTIGLRADMDALPMTEETGAKHASRNEGVFHGCGHDGHTTMLLG